MANLGNRVARLEKDCGMHGCERDIVITVCNPSDNIAGYEGPGGTRTMRLPGESLEHLKERATAAFLPLVPPHPRTGRRVLIMPEIFYSELKEQRNG